MFIITKEILSGSMKRLIEEAPQTSNDLIIANAAYSYIFLENNCSQQYAVPNMLATY